MVNHLCLPPTENGHARRLPPPDPCRTMPDSRPVASGVVETGDGPRSGTGSRGRPRATVVSEATVTRRPTSRPRPGVRKRRRCPGRGRPSAGRSRKNGCRKDGARSRSPAIPRSQFLPGWSADCRCPITGSIACRRRRHCFRRRLTRPRRCPDRDTVASPAPSRPGRSGSGGGGGGMLPWTPNSYRRWALPLRMHSTSGACRRYRGFRPFCSGASNRRAIARSSANPRSRSDLPAVFRSLSRPPTQVGLQTLDRTVHPVPWPGRGNPVRPPRPGGRRAGETASGGSDRSADGAGIVLAATGLPVGILHPTGDHRLVRGWGHRLQRLPLDHPTRGLTGTTTVGAVPHTEGLVEPGPVQGPGPANPRMARIQPVLQAISEPIVGFGTRTGSGTQVVLGNGKEGSVHESISGHWNPYFQGIDFRIFRSWPMNLGFFRVDYILE